MLNQNEIQELRLYVTSKLQYIPNFKCDSTKIEKIITDFSNSHLSLTECKEQIEARINLYIKRQTEEKIESLKILNSIPTLEKDSPCFGEVYKTYIIHIFKIYENIQNSNIPDKKSTFESLLKGYLEEHLEKMMQLLEVQTSSEKLKSVAPTELHLGAETLNYETVGNLYNIFLNDQNLVSNDSEGKMYVTVPNTVKIFKEPHLGEDGKIQINQNIPYNFNMIKETYDFAKQHGKKIKFHTFLWHNAIPENLKKEIDSEPNPELKRKMALTFLDDYAQKLSQFMKENNYPLRQIEVLNEIANDSPNEAENLRKSWWKEVIGTNPQTDDDYYIDVLKIVRNHFPNTELIYNEYNEFLDYKADRICNIINQTRKIEKRDGITLLNGIGLQGHYTDYCKQLERNLQDKDIYSSAYKFSKACGNDKKIYITEYDFLKKTNSNSRDELENAIFSAYSKIANGFIMWGNSDSLTWNHCIGKDGKTTNPHLISSSGIPKKNYYKAMNAFRAPGISPNMPTNNNDDYILR